MTHEEKMEKLIGHLVAIGYYGNRITIQAEIGPYLLERLLKDAEQLDHDMQDIYYTNRE